jgi:hypothetical protein
MRGEREMVGGIRAFRNLIFIDPCIVDYSVEIPTRCSSVVEFIIPKFIEGSSCFVILNRNYIVNYFTPFKHVYIIT